MDKITLDFGARLTSGDQDHLYATDSQGKVHALKYYAVSSSYCIGDPIILVTGKEVGTFALSDGRDTILLKFLTLADFVHLYNRAHGLVHEEHVHPENHPNCHDCNAMQDEHYNMHVDGDHPSADCWMCPDYDAMADAACGK